MDSPFQHTSSFYLVLIFCVTLGISGCEDPGGVGSDITEPESEVASDTLILSGTQVMSPNSYSGELNYFSAGQYDDHLFGNMTAVGYLKPNLPLRSDSIHAEDVTVFMKLKYDSQQVYGDSLSTQGFDIYEIDQPWRDRALKIDDELQLSEQKLGEFTVDTRDSITVNLSDMAPQWVEEYLEYANALTDTTNSDADSAYKYEAHGLALVPNNSGKIIPIYRDSTRFIIQNPEVDTLRVLPNRWGYSLDRDDTGTLPEGSLPLHSTYESIINFGDLGGITELDIQPFGVARAELVFYQNKAALESGPAELKRPKETTINLHLADPDNIPENIDPGVPGGIFKVTGTFLDEDNTYRFNITSLVERILSSGYPAGREFFVTFPNNGVIKSTVLNADADEVGDAFKPKIIITSLKNTGN